MSHRCSTACADQCMLCLVVLACTRESKQVCMLMSKQMKPVPNVNSSSTGTAKCICAFIHFIHYSLDFKVFGPTMTIGPVHSTRLSVAQVCFLGDNKPAVWPSESGAAYLIPTWLVREQRLAQVNINKSSVLLQVSIVNSTWTAGHIRQLWWKWEAPTVVFPPCNTLTLQQLPIDRKLKRLYLVSVAQFRPEKNHRLQLEAFARARQAALQDPDSAGWSHPHPCPDIQWVSVESAYQHILLCRIWV